MGARKSRKADKKIVEKFEGKLNLAWSGRAWFNDEWTAQYLEATIGPKMFSNRLLVWDSFRCHISAQTKATLKQLGLHTAVVPGGCTGFVQAPDVSWNMPFKQHIQREYNNWMLAADREWTVKGNPRAPGMEVYLGWISNAWDSLTREAIQKSFKTCGITNNPDGSEDHLIHCLRPDGSIPLGQELLRKARLEKDVEVIVPEEPDEDEDVNNGYKSDEDIAQ
ncbi:DDE superfamily endonuclease domain-containing protein [Ditylenchus destructor]|uniref:DDE superfamily endonuclease domain-containing protein n=1 Tax=Ditylenchus destructor TaxID=166010 RepID=A0AAD4QTW6_9BILA|nr:DDE superfamily endonuclease domain-containing protein [Ditylenchus destructor]